MNGDFRKTAQLSEPNTPGRNFWPFLYSWLCAFLRPSLLRTGISTLNSVSHTDLSPHSHLSHQHRSIPGPKNSTPWAVIPVQDSSAANLPFLSQYLSSFSCPWQTWTGFVKEQLFGQQMNLVRQEFVRCGRRYTWITWHVCKDWGSRRTTSRVHIQSEWAKIKFWCQEVHGSTPTKVSAGESSPGTADQSPNKIGIEHLYALTGLTLAIDCIKTSRHAGFRVQITTVKLEVQSGNGWLACLASSGLRTVTITLPITWEQRWTQI